MAKGLGQSLTELMYMLSCCMCAGFVGILYLLACLVTPFTLLFFLPGWVRLNSKYFFCTYPRLFLCSGILGNAILPLVYYLTFDFASPVDVLNLEFSTYLKAEVVDQFLLDAVETASRRQLDKSSGRRRLKEEISFRDWQFTGGSQRRLSESPSFPAEEPSFLDWMFGGSGLISQRRLSRSAGSAREELSFLDWMSGGSSLASQQHLSSVPSFPSEELSFRDWKFSENASFGRRRSSSSSSFPREELTFRDWKVSEVASFGRRRFSSSSSFHRDKFSFHSWTSSQNASFGQRQLRSGGVSLIGRPQADALTPRRLATKLRLSTAYTLNVFYKATDDGGGVFNEAALQEMRHFENSLAQAPDYVATCRQLADSANACEAPITASSIFYSLPDVSSIRNDTVQICYDGSGGLASIQGIKRSFIKNDVEYWHDNQYLETKPDLKSVYTRAIFYGGRNSSDTKQDKAARQEHLSQLFFNFLKPLDDEQRANKSPYKHIEISWREPDIVRIERWLYISGDLILAVVAIALVLAIIFWNIKSVFPFCCGLVGIILAFTAAIFLQKFLWGISTLSALDLVSLFIISGLAADNLILVYHVYTSGKERLGLTDDPAGCKHTKERAECLWQALKSIWPAMFATTASTCLSFYSNAASPITVVRAFGLFMGTLAICNVANVFLIFAPSILVCDANPPLCCCRRPSVPMNDFTRRWSQRWSASKDRYEIMKKRVRQHSTLFSWASIGSCLLLSGISALLAYVSFETTQTLDIWPTDINLGRDTIEIKNFQTSSRQSLDKAQSFYPSSPTECAKNVVGSCPLGQSGSFCSDQGNCDVGTGICDCFQGFVGQGCSVGWKAGTMELASEPILRYVYVLSPIHDRVPLSADPYIVNVTVQNLGDTKVNWAVKWRAKSSWISFSRNTTPQGMLPNRSFDRQDAYLPGTSDIELNMSLAGMLGDWSVQDEMFITSSTPWVRDVSLTVVGAVARPPALDDFALFAHETGDRISMKIISDSRIDSLAAKEGWNLRDLPAQIIYTASAPFEVAAVRVGASASVTSVSKILAGEDVVEVDENGTSLAIPLPVRWPRKLNITVLVSSPIVGVETSNYTVQFTRGDPPWSEFMYGNMTLNVSSCTELESEEGRTQLANGIVKVARVEMTMLYRLDITCFLKNYSTPQSQNQSQNQSVNQSQNQSVNQSQNQSVSQPQNQAYYHAEVNYGIEIPAGSRYRFGDVKANLEHMMDNLLRFTHIAFRSGWQYDIQIISATTFMDDLVINLPTSTTATTTYTSTSETTTITSATVTSTSATSSSSTISSSETTTTTATTETTTITTATTSSTTTLSITSNTVTSTSSSESSTITTSATSSSVTATFTTTTTTVSTTLSTTSASSTHTTNTATITSTTTSASATSLTSTISTSATSSTASSTGTSTSTTVTFSSTASSTSTHSDTVTSTTASSTRTHTSKTITKTQSTLTSSITSSTGTTTISTRSSTRTSATITATTTTLTATTATVTATTATDTATTATVTATTVTTTVISTTWTTRTSTLTTPTLTKTSLTTVSLTSLTFTPGRRLQDGFTVDTATTSTGSTQSTTTRTKSSVSSTTLTSSISSISSTLSSTSMSLTSISTSTVTGTSTISSISTSTVTGTISSISTTGTTSTKVTTTITQTSSLSSTSFSTTSPTITLTGSSTQTTQTTSLTISTTNTVSTDTRTTQTETTSASATVSTTSTTYSATKTSTNTTKSFTFTSSSTTTSTGTTFTSTFTTSTERYPDGSDMIEGFITVEVSNCAVLDTENGRKYVALSLLALALDSRTDGIPADKLLKHWEDEYGIHVRVVVQCGSNLLGARMLAGTQATIQYNVLGLSTDSEDWMPKLLDRFFFASPAEYNAYFQYWGDEVVRLAGLSVLSVTEAQAGRDEYCPGMPVFCSGHGTCNRTKPKNLGDASWYCNCDTTYTGDNCSIRECPPCVSAEGCRAGNQTLDSVWECICPNNCSGGGQCGKFTGLCDCDEMYKEIDCSVAPTGRPPLASTIEVSLIWGLKGYSSDNTSEPEYDEDFDFFDPRVQEFIEQTCKEAMLSGELMVREEQPCWIETFRKYVINVNGSFPIQSGETSEALQSFMHYYNWAFTPKFNAILTSEDQALLADFKGDIETSGLHFSGRVMYVRVRLRSNMVTTDSGRHKLREKWERFIAERMKYAPYTVGTPFMVGQVWAEMSLESDIQIGVATGMLVALGGSLLVVGIFLRRVGTTLLVILNMMLVVCVIGGFLLFVHGYEFGPVEMIGSTVMVGMGVDYCLHLAHGYQEVPDEGLSSAAHALKHYSASIIGGAMTTTIGVFVLTQCRMVLFQKLGWALSSNALVSVSYTFFFLAPSFVLLDAIHCRRSRRHGKDSEDAVEGEASVAGGASQDIHSDGDQSNGEDGARGEGEVERVGERVGEDSHDAGNGEGPVADKVSARAEGEGEFASDDKVTESWSPDDIDLEEDRMPVEEVRL
eukprot:TRINITY_DN192_c0_g1_i1.p1 TRINITY_DN192_c0_g1~~TRINITY_DN192_c0_g1_i1.p1  ORF type:complete len:2499 (-),score=288.05 TRINITY_DN192_c0_g1_i1:285-7706(-)